MDSDADPVDLEPDVSDPCLSPVQACLVSEVLWTLRSLTDEMDLFYECW